MPAFTFFCPLSQISLFFASHLFLPLSSSISFHTPLDFHLPHFWSILWVVFFCFPYNCVLLSFQLCISSSLLPFLSFQLLHFFLSPTLSWPSTLFQPQFFLDSFFLLTDLCFVFYSFAASTFFLSTFLCYCTSLLASFWFLASTLFFSLVYSISTHFLTPPTLYTEAFCSFSVSHSSLSPTSTPLESHLYIKPPLYLMVSPYSSSLRLSGSISQKDFVGVPQYFSPSFSLHFFALQSSTLLWPPIPFQPALFPALYFPPDSHCFSASHKKKCAKIMDWNAAGKH